MKNVTDTKIPFKPAPEKKSTKRIGDITFTTVSTGTPLAKPTSKEMAEPVNKR